MTAAQWAEDERGLSSLETPSGTTDLMERLVRDEVRKQRARKIARQILDSEDDAERPEFDGGTVGEIRARPSGPAHRVEGLIPSEGGTLLTAQRKAGKTTMTLNLARSLVTGEDFLGRFGVQPITGNVALLNYEVGGQQVADWAHEHGVPEPGSTGEVGGVSVA